MAYAAPVKLHFSSKDSSAPFHHPSSMPYPVARGKPTKPQRPPLNPCQTNWPLPTLVMTNTPTALPAGPLTAPSYVPAHHTQARNVSEIIPRLYISDLAFAEHAPSLAGLRVTHILSALPDKVHCPPAHAFGLLQQQPVVRLQVRVEDLPFAELAAHLPATTAWIREALRSSPDARVLVHCVEGISRSASVVAAFLMAQYGWAPLEAVQYVKSKRRIADPNFGFVQQLHEYARDSLGREGVPPVSQQLQQQQQQQLCLPPGHQGQGRAGPYHSARR